MYTAPDLTGQKFGMLTVLGRVENHIRLNGKKESRWKCLCDCGNEVIVLGKSLKNENTKSCGCIRNKKIYINGKNNKKYNKYDIETHNYGIGWTNKNEEFYFDLEDYDKIKDYCWHIDTYGYVISNTPRGGKQTTVKLHRLIMGFPSGFEIDHISHNKNDNRKENLRIVTSQENMMNKNLYSNNTSGVAGVSFDKSCEKWFAQITLNGKHIFLGYFSNKEDAIKARLEAEIKYFGEYKNKNINIDENLKECTNYE